MPNYRLTHKITGTTAPETAGYYGLDSQSSTVWKRAGGGAYAWQSPTFANTFFMGATVDLSAYNTVTISGANDHLTQDIANSYVVIGGTTLAYTSIENYRPKYEYDAGGYPAAMVYDGSQWAYGFNGNDYTNPSASYLPPTTGWSPTLSPAFNPSPNAALASTFNGAFVYGTTASKWLKGTTHSLWKNGTVWTMTDGVVTYTAADNGLNTPPATGWVYKINGIDAATATLSVTSSVKFAAISLGGTWQAVNGGSGVPVYEAPIIGDAWYRAEETAFESLTAYFGCTEGNNCFRGFLPVMGDGDDMKFVDVWQMSSGGSGQFDVDRLAGDSGAWCSLRSDARIESLWKTRRQAMEFAGAVCAWLKETNNLKQIDNVLMCRLMKIPEEPKTYRTEGQNRQRYWQQTIELEFVFLTEGLYT